MSRRRNRLIACVGLMAMLGMSVCSFATPTDPVEQFVQEASLWQLLPVVFVSEFTGHLIRYLMMAGGAFLLFYVLFRRVAQRRKIQERNASRRDVRREVLYSLSSFAVFGGAAIVTTLMHRAGWNQVYLDVAEYGLIYFWVSVVALIFLHDAWFYWTHRAMHSRLLFKHVHKVHHLSHNPTPWAAFAFHPLEAVVEAAIFPLLVIVMPVHPMAALLWLMYMTFMNVGGHLGFEILPAGFVRHRLLKWHNTSVHHNMHHSRFNCNYGLYFNIWDRLLGTNHVDYEREYDRVTAPPDAAEAPAVSHPTSPQEA